MRLFDPNVAAGPASYILKVVCLGALPAALLFATVNLFPVRVGYPFEHVAHPITYLFLWIVLGVVYGIGRWVFRERDS